MPLLWSLGESGALSDCGSTHLTDSAELRAVLLRRKQNIKSEVGNGPTERGSISATVASLPPRCNRTLSCVHLGGLKTIPRPLSAWRLSRDSSGDYAGS